MGPPHLLGAPPHTRRAYNFCHVQKHQKPLQLRSPRDRCRDSRRLSAICPEDQRLQQALESERSRLQHLHRRSSRRVRPPPALARNHRPTQEPRRRSRKSKSPIRRAIRASLISSIKGRHSERSEESPHSLDAEQLFNHPPHLLHVIMCKMVHLGQPEPPSKVPFIGIFRDSGLEL
jgi:hypothetical protein